MRIFFLLLLTVLTFSAGLTFAELQAQLMQQLTSPFVSLMFIYDGSTQLGPNLKLGIEDIAKRREDYFKVLAIDCNTDDQDLLKNFPYCSKQIRAQLPALLFTEPNINQVDPKSGENFQPKNHVYQGNLQDKALYDFAVPLMKLYSVNLKKSSDWLSFKQAYPETPKVLYFTDKDKISPFYKTLTAHFRNTIAFAHVFKNSTLCEQFGITQFPSLVLNGEQKIEMTTDLHAQVQILKQHEGPQAKIVIEQFRDSTQSLDQSNIQEKIYENPRHILIHVPSADGKAHTQWKKCQQNFRKMFDYFETETLASKLGVKSRPAIVYFPKSLAKKDVKKTVFYPNDHFRAIYDEIAGLIEDFTIPLAGDPELQQMLSLSIKEDKLVSVLFHKQEISLSYRVLSNEEQFKENIVFVRMRNPDPQIMKKFKIKKLPALFVMSKAEENATETQPKRKGQESEEEKKTFSLQIAQYTGKYNYDDLEKYLNYFIEKPAEEGAKSQRKVAQFTSKKKYQSACSGQSCYLLLLDNGPEKKAANQQYIKIIQKSLADVYQPVGYIDAKCHSQIISKLQINTQELPVVVYLNSKFQKYSRLVGRIEQKSIQAFKNKIKANKGIWRTFQKLSFQNKNCEKEHQRLKQLESSYQMSAQDAQILEEIKREEEKKKLQANAGEAQSKKKRRRRRPKEQQSQL